MRVFFFVPYPLEGASARLRIYQFLPSLNDAGIQTVVRPFLTPRFYAILYRRGHYPAKFALFVWRTAMRFFDLIEALFCDVVVIHREAFPLGPPVIEAILFLFGKKVIFDFDDAIYLPPEGSRPVMALLKCPTKTDFIIRHSRAIIAGNEFLREHAARLNKHVVVIPTSIDTEVYAPARAGMGTGDIVIGWVGSHTTQVFLKEMGSVFEDLLQRYPRLRIHIVGGQPGLFNNERIVVREWSLDREKGVIDSFSIGIMPMPDTAWTRGKCAFKAILYMSMAIPVVVSCVGVNERIVADGVNGFLARTSAEWIDKLTRLIDDAGLRRSLGEAGRSTVEKGYSVRVTAPAFVQVIMQAGKK